MLKTGDRFDCYEIIVPLGADGMGGVYRVRHVVLGRNVALKVLWPNLVMQPNVREHFVQEACVQAAPDHPGLVVVTDVIVTRSALALVMPLVEGPSLEWVIEHERPGVWSLGEAISLLRGIAAAVAHAHRMGVVHRDIKPANVLLERKGAPPWPGAPRIVDFGLAKVLGSAGGLTRTGARMGTLVYMAPEQFRGERGVDARADVYALGVLAWRLLAGRLPADANDLQGVLAVYAGTQPIERLDAVNPQVPEALATVVARALSVDAGKRPADAGEFLEALEALTVPGDAITSDGRQPPVGPAERKPSTEAPAAVSTGTRARTPPPGAPPEPGRARAPQTRPEKRRDEDEQDDDPTAMEIRWFIPLQEDDAEHQGTCGTRVRKGGSCSRSFLPHSLARLSRRRSEVFFPPWRDTSSRW